MKLKVLMEHSRLPLFYQTLSVTVSTEFIEQTKRKELFEDFWAINDFTAGLCGKFIHYGTVESQKKSIMALWIAVLGKVWGKELKLFENSNDWLWKRKRKVESN